MKCQKCGKNDVNFHYSSNINGCVTEAHLCSECATESGCDIGQILNIGNIRNSENIIGSIFNNLFPILSKAGGHIPGTIPAMNLNSTFPGTAHQRISGHTQTNVRDSGCATGTAATQTATVDDEMRKRRELYQQMYIAAENEDFEKAAQLRDVLKELEA